MKIIRQNNYSDNKKQLKATRVGIGWLQEGLGKNESEEVFKEINKQIDKDYEEGKSDKEIIKNAKNKGKKEVLKKDLPKLIKNTSLAAGLTGLGAYESIKHSKEASKLISTKLHIDPSVERKIENSLVKAKKHKGKISLGLAGIAGAAELSKKGNLQRTRKRIKASSNGGERVATERLKSKKK